MCKCREDEPESERFIRKRGFPLVGKEPASALDVTAFDAAQFTDRMERVRQQGIEIIQYAELVARMPDWQERCYAMNCVSRLDIPATGEHTPRPFEEYIQRRFTGDTFMPELNFFAVDRGELVGETNLFKNAADPEHLLTDYTGIIPSRRRQGIATALKVSVIQQAQSMGVKTIHTGNHETNPMYQINLNLGFQTQPGELLFELHLE